MSDTAYTSERAYLRAWNDFVLRRDAPERAKWPLHKPRARVEKKGKML